MSHFGVLVLTDPDSDSDVETLLAPYDENITVAPYQEDCYCLKSGRIRRAHEAAAKLFGTMGSLHVKYRKLGLKSEYDNPSPTKEELEYAEKRWYQIAGPYLAYYEEKLKSFKPIPDPSCEDCKGTGKIMSTYNPNSKWDCYEVGGRWKGSLASGSDSGCVSQLVESDANQIYAVVTPDGVWHGRGDMGWFGMSSGDMDESDWRNEVWGLIQANKDCYYTLVDCHI
jgi:hypothetical protein